MHKIVFLLQLQCTNSYHCFHNASQRTHIYLYIVVLIKKDRDSSVNNCLRCEGIGVLALLWTHMQTSNLLQCPQKIQANVMEEDCIWVQIWHGPICSSVQLPKREGHNYMQLKSTYLQIGLHMGPQFSGLICSCPATNICYGIVCWDISHKI